MVLGKARRRRRDRPTPDGWRRSTFLLPSPEPAEVQVVEEARLTRFRAGPLRTASRPNRWIHGAAYDSERRLVPASQRMRGKGGDFVVAADPLRGPGRPSPNRLAGTWLYGGHLMGHFGHFITETLTTLWTAPPDLDGLVFHRWISAPVAVEPWQQSLFDLIGLSGVPIELVDKQPVDVELLHVPGRPFVVGGWIEPQAVDVWRRVGRALARSDGPHRVYLSRTGFNAGLAALGRPSRSSPARDLELDRDFAAAGFDVVFAEELEVSEQIGLVAGAKVVAGAAGSALHLSAFTPKPALVVEVGDDRSPRRLMPGQRLINTACGHLSAFVPAAARAGDVLGRLDFDIDPGEPLPQD